MSIESQSKKQRCGESEFEPSPTMQTLLPRELIAPLKKLGETDWLKVVTEVDRHHLVITEDVEGLLEKYPSILRIILELDELDELDGSLLLQLFAYSRLLADGPKIVQPTADECEALAQIDLNLTFREYQQPFPAFLVELPVSVQDRLTKEYGVLCPRFAVPFCERKQDFLAVLCADGVQNTNKGALTVFSKDELDQRMEDSRKEIKGDKGPNYQQALVIERISLNLALLLTRFGYEDNGPLYPKTVEKQTKLVNRGSERKQQQARRLLDSSISRVSLSQNVRLCSRGESSPPSDDAFGSQKSPHWRRGHFRRAKVGQGRTDSRLIFIRPCFINRQHFDGSMSDTEYRIRTAKRAVLKRCLKPGSRSKSPTTTLKKRTTCSDDPINTFQGGQR